MASISVRKLDDNVYDLLRDRASRHGLSMEEEVRQIISQAVATPRNVADVFRAHFGKQNGVDLQMPQHKPHDPMDF